MGLQQKLIRKYFRDYLPMKEDLRHARKTNVFKGKGGYKPYS